MARIWLSLAVVLSACVDIPELGDRVAPDLRDAPFPQLLPIDVILDQTPAPQEQAVEVQNDLAARVAALRARAARLQGPVVDPNTLRRMEQGVPAPG